MKIHQLPLPELSPFPSALLPGNGLLLFLFSTSPPELLQFVVVFVEKADVVVTFNLILVGGVVHLDALLP